VQLGSHYIFTQENVQELIYVIIMSVHSAWQLVLQFTKRKLYYMCESEMRFVLFFIRVANIV